MVRNPRGLSPGCQRCLLYLIAMLCILQHISKMFSRAFRGDCLWSWDMCVVVAVQVIGGENHLPGNGHDEHGCLLCRWGPSWSNVGEIQLVTVECLICLLEGILDCLLWGFSSHYQFKGTELAAPSVKEQNGYCTNLGVQGVRLWIMHLVCWPRFSSSSRTVTSGWLV